MRIYAKTAEEAYFAQFRRILDNGGTRKRYIENLATFTEPDRGGQIYDDDVRELERLRKLAGVPCFVCGGNDK